MKINYKILFRAISEVSGIIFAIVILILFVKYFGFINIMLGIFPIFISFVYIHKRYRDLAKKDLEEKTGKQKEYFFIEEPKRGTKKFPTFNEVIDYFDKYSQPDLDKNS